MQIIADIVDITTSGVSKTHVMYRANLSFAQTNEYLPFLLEIELLTHTTQNGRKIYKATPKGMRFLHGYAKIMSLLMADGELKGKNTRV